MPYPILTIDSGTGETFRLSSGGYNLSESEVGVCNLSKFHLAYINTDYGNHIKVWQVALCHMIVNSHQALTFLLRGRQ